MPDIGACDARTHLPKLLERVQRGERFFITMHGWPIAELVPVATRDSAPTCDAVAGIRERRQALADRGVRSCCLEVKLVILPLAVGELNDAAAFYVASANVELGSAFVAEFDRAASEILANPQIGPVFRGTRRR